jgi:Flp pilus assembly protein TadG
MSSRLLTRASVAANQLLDHLRSALRRLRLNRSGNAAIEFALLGPVFIILMCGIVENGLILFTQSALDNATRVAARQILLGTTTSDAFRATLCNNVSGMIPACKTTGNLNFSVQSGISFGSFGSTISTDSNGNMTNTQFNPGGEQQKVLIQVGYNRPFLIPLYGLFAGVKSELLVSTIAMKSEPY